MILEKLLTTYAAKPNLIIFTRENQGKNPEAWKEKGGDDPPTPEREF
jgi:hypothetical protein